MNYQQTLEFVEKSRLPTSWGEFDIYGFEDREQGKEHVAITMGDLSGEEPVLLRIHSECLTGDALFSLRCDCGAQLQEAMKNIAAEGRGVILYLRQEGRGIGLLNKIKAYHLQDAGADTVEANERLGFGADERDYKICGPMLNHLGIEKVRLMTNNPHKVVALQHQGFSVVESLRLRTGRNPHNADYLATKAGKLGHMFSDSGD